MENIPVITPYAIALYTFKGQLADELSFEANDIILLTNHIDDNWLEGEIDGKSGIFPANRVAIQVDCVKSEAATTKARVSTSSKRHSEISKSFPTNPFLTECDDNDKGLIGAVQSNAHSSVSWSASFDDGFKPDSVRAGTDPWLSASFDFGTSPSQSFTSYSTKRSVLKSNSVPVSFPVEDQRKCGRKPFILKNKPAPSVPWVGAFSLPSNNPWEVTGNSVRPSPTPRPVSSKVPISASDKSPSPKDKAAKLFGEFGYAKLFRAHSDNENIQKSDEVEDIGTNKQTTATTNSNATRSNTKTNTVAVHSMLKNYVVKAPMPVPRRRNSDNTATINKETKKQIENGLAPVPAPRRSILMVKESGNINEHETNTVEKQTIAFKQTGEADKNGSVSNKLYNITDKVTLNGNKSNFDFRTTVTDIPTQTNTEISDDVYSEIVAETADDYYAVIEPNSSENEYTAMPTLDFKAESNEDKFQTGNTNLKIPPPPMSKRNKLTQRSISLDASRLNNSGASESLKSKIQTFDRISMKIPTVTSVKTENSKDVIAANNQCDNSESQSDLNKATSTNYYSTPGNAIEKEENIYEAMWPVQQMLTPGPAPDINIPPPLPPKKRPISAKTWNIEI